MNGPTITNVRKYIAAIKRSSRKYLTAEHLSKDLGIFPDAINKTLSYFDPLVIMDFNYNVRNLLETMEKYVQEMQKIKKKATKPRIVVTKKDLIGYESVIDFVSQKLVFTSGLFDRNALLSDGDLRILKRLINLEQAERKLLKNSKK